MSAMQQPRPPTEQRPRPSARAETPLTDGAASAPSLANGATTPLVDRGATSPMDSDGAATPLVNRVATSLADRAVTPPTDGVAPSAADGATTSLVDFTHRPCCNLCSRMELRFRSRGNPAYCRRCTFACRGSDNSNYRQCSNPARGCSCDPAHQWSGEPARQPCSNLAH